MLKVNDVVEVDLARLVAVQYSTDRPNYCVVCYSDDKTLLFLQSVRFPFAIVFCH